VSEVSIRAATAADIPVLLRHRRMMWWDMGRRDELALDVMSAAATQYFTKAVTYGTYQGFLAVALGAAVIGGGGVVISSWPGVLGQKRPQRAMILNLYVEREYRRQGIARKLMQSMIDWCRQQDFISVGLHASDEGRALYEQLGFEPTNEMQLELGTVSRS